MMVAFKPRNFSMVAIYGVCSIDIVGAHRERTIVTQQINKICKKKVFLSKSKSNFTIEKASYRHYL